MSRAKFRLTAAQLDRATGAVCGMAVGNALGAGFAFQPRPRADEVRMSGSGLGTYAAGEWVDDTAMALPILQVLAAGGDLVTPEAQDAVVAGWVQWRSTTDDLAPIIAKVLDTYDPQGGARSLQQAALAFYAQSVPGSAGNASLMRTTPIVLGYLDDPQALANASRIYSDLTHAHPQAGDACVLWNQAQRHAILTGEFDLVVGLPWIPAERQAFWAKAITQAEVGSPEDFAVRNGWVSQVLQTAWSAITHCDVPGPDHFEATLRVAVAAGGDTATVAAVTGGLLGARWGVSAIPLDWRRSTFGWPGYREGDLQRDVFSVVGHGSWPAVADSQAGPGFVVAHPADAGVLLGDVPGLAHVPPDVQAVVSLCRSGTDGALLPAWVAPENHAAVWLRASDCAADNPNLELVAREAVEMICRMRNEGLSVFVHCDDGAQRTPFIAALYAAECCPASATSAYASVAEVLPRVRTNPVFERLLAQYG